jgi:small glutamine-rich tetratricopeptide repeat-containing protein alpha
LDQYDLAIQDCRTALALDPNYAKAYGRMGVALSCQNRYDQAVEAYKRAVELDPGNDSYKGNLTIAEEKLREAQENAGGAGGIPGMFNSNLIESFLGFPGFGALGGLGGMFNNPQMQEMAAQMMTDPNIQNMMGQMMGAFQPDGNGAGGGLENLMRVGEQVSYIIRHV